MRRPPISCARSACSRAGRSGSVRYRANARSPIRSRTAWSIRGTVNFHQNASASVSRCWLSVATSCAALTCSRAVSSGSSLAMAAASTASHGARSRIPSGSGGIRGTASAAALSPCRSRSPARSMAWRAKASRSARVMPAGSGGPVTTCAVFSSRPRVMPT